MKKTEFERPELSEVENLTLQLALANKKLKNIENMRTDMLANISHDLRTPMTAIRSSVDYLNSFSKDSMISYEELSATLRIIDMRCTTLEKLINDLFFLTSLENSANDMHYTDISFLPFLEEYYFSTEADGRFDDRQLFLDIPDDLKVNVKIDSECIITVLDNLFVNALKYSASGAEIRLNAFLADEHTICVSLRDTGIGIPEDCLTKIFQRSFTVSHSRTPNTSTGSGLGLSIVKSIIERHNGNVWCESELGKGSIFYFTLPCTPFL